jgi:hypothetical protein
MPDLTSDLMTKIESSVKIASDDKKSINEMFVIKNIAFNDSSKDTFEFVDIWLFADEIDEESSDLLSNEQEISKEIEEWLSSGGNEYENEDLFSEILY